MLFTARYTEYPPDVATTFLLKKHTALSEAMVFGFLAEINLVKTCDPLCTVTTRGQHSEHGKVTRETMDEWNGVTVVMNHKSHHSHKIKWTASGQVRCCHTNTFMKIRKNLEVNARDVRPHSCLYNASFTVCHIFLLGYSHCQTKTKLVNDENEDNKDVHGCIENDVASFSGSDYIPGTESKEYDESELFPLRNTPTLLRKWKIHQTTSRCQLANILQTKHT